MVDAAHWFGEQLQVSADHFVRGAEQVPSERRDARPPLGLGKWPVARHVFHMLHYEQHVALPSMRQWLGGPAVRLGESDEKVAWGQGQDLAASVRGFRAVRQEQIALLPEFEAAAWDEVRQTLWGPVTLRWVVSKTYQHTFEHTSNVLRIHLFWDFYGFSGVVRLVVGRMGRSESDATF